MSKIKIDTETLRNKIEELKVENKKIDDVLNKFKTDTSNMESFWTGVSGDSAKEEMNVYTGKFESLSNHMQKFVSFLEYVAKSYEDEDKFIIDKIESNANIPAK